MDSRRGTAYSSETVKKVKQQMTLRKKRRNGPKKTVDKIKNELGIRSRTTIYNLWTQDNTKEGRLERRLKKGTRRLFTIQQEKIISGFIVLRSSVHKNTSSFVLRSFIKEFFGKEVNNSWISRFANRNHLSFRTAKAKVKANVEESDEISMQEFLKRVHAMNKRPSQIACVDKTSIYSQTVYPLQLGPLGSGTLSRETPPKNHKITVFTMLVGNGTVGGFYALVDKKKISADVVPAEDSKVLILPSKERRGERAMLAYLEWCVEKGYLVAGDLLLTDNEASFKTEEVRNFLNDKHIDIDYFPTYRGSIMNPCDNSFHATFKHHYYASILDRTTLTMEEKLSFAREAYFAIEEDSIQKMFERTGLTTKDIQRTVKSLITEGLHLNPHSEIAHTEQIKAFEKWAHTEQFSFDREVESGLLKDVLSVNE